MRVSKGMGCPDRLLSPTIGDVLKEATKGKAKVFGLSFKDRSAVLPVGKQADGAYWLDSADGMIVTSTYYRDSVHPGSPSSIRIGLPIAGSNRNGRNCDPISITPSTAVPMMLRVKERVSNRV